MILKQTRNAIFIFLIYFAYELIISKHETLYALQFLREMFGITITKFLLIRCCTIIKIVIHLFHLCRVALIITLIFVGHNKYVILYDLSHNIYLILFHIPIAS